MHGKATCTNSSSGDFHIYNETCDVGYFARKLLASGWGPQGWKA